MHTYSVHFIESHLSVNLFLMLNTYRAEKLAEITSWLKSHPVSSVTRTSCELQVLDAAIVERIEEAVEKIKVMGLQTLHSSAIFHQAPSLDSQTSVSLGFHVGKEELQETACNGEASSPFQSEYLSVLKGGPI